MILIFKVSQKTWSGLSSTRNPVHLKLWGHNCNKGSILFNGPKVQVLWDRKSGSRPTRVSNMPSGLLFYHFFVIYWEVTSINRGIPTDSLEFPYFTSCIDVSKSHVRLTDLPKQLLVISYSTGKGCKEKFRWEKGLCKQTKGKWEPS